MKPGHTPPPWMIEQPGDLSHHLWINGPDNTGLAIIQACDHDDGQGERISDEDQANARLIVAAPELLELLCEVTWVRGPDGNPTPWMAKVLSVIARIEGAA